MDDVAAGAGQGWLSLVRDVPDFPESGVVFKDIAPVLADATAFQAAVEGLAAAGRDDDGRPCVDVVAGVEARGFILAAPVALALHAGLVPVRKAGKLPGPTLAESYALEYGEATLEVQSDAFRPGAKVLVVDDVLATGGTMCATCRLVERAGARVHGVAVLLELTFLSGRDALPGIDVLALAAVQPPPAR